MLQSLICLLGPGAEACVNGLRFLIAGYGGLAHLDLEPTVEQSEDNTIQK